MSKMAAEQELKRVEGVLLVQEASSRLEFIFWIFNLPRGKTRYYLTCVLVQGCKDRPTGRASLFFKCTLQAYSSSLLVKSTSQVYFSSEQNCYCRISLGTIQWDFRYLECARPLSWNFHPGGNFIRGIDCAFQNVKRWTLGGQNSDFMLSKLNNRLVDHRVSEISTFLLVLSKLHGILILKQSTVLVAERCSLIAAVGKTACFFNIKNAFN